MADLFETRHRDCPLCGSRESHPLIALPAWRFAETNATYAPNYQELLGIDRTSEFPIVRCDRCSFVFALFDLSPAFLETLYGCVIDPLKAGQESQSISWTAHQFRLASLALSSISLKDPPAKLLDYGCGYGTLVRAMRGPYAATIGYEPARGPSDAARSEGLAVFRDFADVQAQAPFDAIVLSDVLEHLSKPIETLSACRELLRSGGVICISVPDFSERRMKAAVEDARAGREFTRELNPWEHLNYFSPATLAAMVVKAGFTVMDDAQPDFGFRAGERGMRRAANMLMSMLRMLRFARRGEPLTTTIVARLK